MHEPHIDAIPEIHSSAYVSNSATIVGDVILKRDSSVWPQVVIRGDMNRIEIGERSNVQDGSILHITHKNEGLPNGHPLLIGNDVTIGHKACLHGCKVEDNVLIGIGAIVLDGALISKNTIVAAGALVPPNKKLDSGFLYVGSPVKKQRKLTEQEIQYFTYSAKNYVNLKNEFLNKRPHFY